MQKDAFFCCAQLQTLYSSTASLFPPHRREQTAPRRTRVKIEQHIGSRPNSFPGYFHSKKESSQTDALAVGCSDIFHGVRRHIRNGRNYSWRGLWPRDFDSSLFAGALEFADSVHDWGTFERAAAGGRLLRVGAAGTWKFLGISGSVAFACRQHF